MAGELEGRRGAPTESVWEKHEFRVVFQRLRRPSPFGGWRGENKRYPLSASERAGVNGGASRRLARSLAPGRVREVRRRVALGSCGPTRTDGDTDRDVEDLVFGSEDEMDSVLGSDPEIGEG